jgi:hypothetical protein
MRKYEDFLRPYLSVELAGEDYPLLIKLKGNDNCCLTGKLISMSIHNGKLVVDFHTGYIVPVDTIEGVEAEIVAYYAGFGSYRAELTIDMKKVTFCEVKYLPEGCDYITCARGYYTRKYGVDYLKHK